MKFCHMALGYGTWMINLERLVEDYHCNDDDSVIIQQLHACSIQLQGVRSLVSGLPSY